MKNNILLRNILNKFIFTIAVLTSFTGYGASTGDSNEYTELPPSSVRPGPSVNDQPCDSYVTGFLVDIPIRAAAGIKSYERVMTGYNESAPREEPTGLSLNGVPFMRTVVDRTPRYETRERNDGTNGKIGCCLFIPKALEMCLASYVLSELNGTPENLNSLGIMAMVGSFWSTVNTLINCGSYTALQNTREVALSPALKIVRVGIDWLGTASFYAATNKLGALNNTDTVDASAMGTAKVLIIVPLVLSVVNLLRICLTCFIGVPR